MTKYYTINSIFETSRHSNLKTFLSK
jgi:hypothetical protein